MTKFLLAIFAIAMIFLVIAGASKDGEQAARSFIAFVFFICIAAVAVLLESIAYGIHHVSIVLR